MFRKVWAHGPGTRKRLIRFNRIPALIREGYYPAGKDKDGRQVFLYGRSFAYGQAIPAEGDTSCRYYAPGQRMGNLFELAGCP